jgi:hypothetical protein
MRHLKNAIAIVGTVTVMLLPAFTTLAGTFLLLESIEFDPRASALVTLSIVFATTIFLVLSAIVGVWLLDKYIDLLEKLNLV